MRGSAQIGYCRLQICADNAHREKVEQRMFSVARLPQQKKNTVVTTADNSKY